MKNPTMTNVLVDRLFIDLTEQDKSIAIEAHEMASYAYDMVNEILEFNK